MAVLGWSHVGVCCTDLARSTAFYEGVFGFRQLFTVELSVPATMETEGTFLSRMLARDDMRLELLQWVSLSPDGDGARRPMTHLGLTHLAFRVSSVEGHYDAARALGGAVHEQTLTRMPGAGTDGADVVLVYLTDPDGVRIELMAGTPPLS